MNANPETSLFTSSLIAVALGILVGTMFSPSPSSTSSFRGEGAASMNQRAVDRMMRYA